MSGELNEGENNVFPIQVSLRELLLFLASCYFYDAYKNILQSDAKALSSLSAISAGAIQAAANLSA